MESGHSLEAVPEDDLLVIPRPGAVQGPSSNKRAFQKRRRSRACDACRLRKTKELNEKLKIAEAKLQSSDISGDSNDPDINPSSSESHNLSARRGGDSPATSTTTGQSPTDRSPRTSISQPLRRFSYDGSTTEDFFVGTTSGLGFLASVQEYVEKLGYDTTSLLDAWKNSEAKAYPTNQTVYSEGSQLRDLRALLPNKQNGKKLLDIFHHSTAR
ncbi:hypothetical protein ABW20_dc0107440 [Dactylellina cionopaga]|nr:hypothetical protein ABW20_dc0107440 [Dactylellina cionopaga]